MGGTFPPMDPPMAAVESSEIQVVPAFSLGASTWWSSALGTLLLQDSSLPILWIWYVLLLLISAFNIAWMTVRMRGVAAPDGYGKTMKFLAVPWVLECAWRSALPSLYLQRFVFWDTWLNAILVDRTWACVGELAWTYQMALALR